MGMNLLVTAAAAEAKGPATAAGGRQPPIRVFMDDLTIPTTSHVQVRWIQKTLGDVASLSRMVFKPRKSRNMVIRNNFSRTEKQADEWLRNIDRTGPPGKFKVDVAK